MLYQDRYEITIVLDGQPYEEMPSEFSFIIADSIWNLYPTAKFYFKDYGGFMQEFLALTDGTKIDMVYGVEDSIITCPFTIKRNGMVDNTFPNSMGGTNEVDMIHRYWYEQGRNSEAHTTPIHTTIRHKAEEFPFNSVNIGTTKNRGTWYQPLMYDGQYMESVLLPHAYDSGSSDTPFYLFIDSNNDFNFQTYHTLFTTAKPVQDLFTVNDNMDTNGNNAIKSVNRLQPDLAILRQHFNKLFYDFDSTGQYLSGNTTITQYPEEGVKFLPIKGNTDLVTSYDCLYSGSTGQDKENEYNNLGRAIFLNREALHVEKLFLVMPLNVNLRAGKKVNLFIADGGDKNTGESSLQYSDPYLIETSYHNWDGNTGSTNLVISRQKVVVPNSYILKQELITG